MTAWWVAPRVGYLLTAAMAGRRFSEASGMWLELDERTQFDVIIALGAQARAAVAEAGVPLQIDFTSLAGSRCPETLAAAQTAYEGAGSWEPPPCPHCRELVASALAEIQLQAMAASGMPASYVDLICRGKAVSGGAWPSSAQPALPAQPALLAQPALPAQPAASGRPAAPSLEEAGHAAVGERLTAGLAGGAVLERGVGEGDLTDRVAADRAGLAGLAVHA
jgi:hypothetical protein